MKTSIIFIFLLFHFPFTAKESRLINPPAPIYPIPSTKQMEWHEMEMNAFIHFTVNTFTDLEWGLGNENSSIFNPSKADTKQWVKVLKEAGFKGIILTCKHHDGFCLWPSKFGSHNIANSPYQGGKGNLVKEVADACRQQRMKFGVYLSPWDRNHAEYGRPGYIEYYRNQLRELCSDYGSVFEIWFDGANGGTGYYGGANERRTIKESYYEWPVTIKLVKELQPHALLFSAYEPGIRWCGNEDGIGGETNWAMMNLDTLYADKPGIKEFLREGMENGTHWIPSEVNVSIRPGWFYHEKENTLVKTPEELFDIYLASVGRGSVLLLNVPPNKEGLLNESDIKSLIGFKKLLKKELGDNLAINATVSCSSVRGNSSDFDGSKVTDSNKETYWATDDNMNTGSLIIHLGKETLVKYILLQEYIKLGQRVKNFTIEAHSGNKWHEIAKGTTIGYKRILRFEPVMSDQVRIRINDSKACPVLSNIEIY